MTRRSFEVLEELVQEEVQLGSVETLHGLVNEGVEGRPLGDLLVEVRDDRKGSAQVPKVEKSLAGEVGGSLQSRQEDVQESGKQPEVRRMLFDEWRSLLVEGLSGKAKFGQEGRVGRVEEEGRGGVEVEKGLEARKS